MLSAPTKHAIVLHVQRDENKKKFWFARTLFSMVLLQEQSVCISSETNPAYWLSEAFPEFRYNPVKNDKRYVCQIKRSGEGKKKKKMQE